PTVRTGARRQINRHEEHRSGGLRVPRLDARQWMRKISFLDYRAVLAPQLQSRISGRRARERLVLGGVGWENVGPIAVVPDLSLELRTQSPVKKQQNMLARVGVGPGRQRFDDRKLAVRLLGWARHPQHHREQSSEDRSYFHARHCPSLMRYSKGYCLYARGAAAK